MLFLPGTFQGIMQALDQLMEICQFKKPWLYIVICYFLNALIFPLYPAVQSPLVSLDNQCQGVGLTPPPCKIYFSVSSKLYKVKSLTTFSTQCYNLTNFYFACVFGLSMIYSKVIVDTKIICIHNQHHPTYTTYSPSKRTAKTHI